MTLDKMLVDNLYQLKRIVSEHPDIFLRKMGYRRAGGYTIDDVYFGCGGVLFEIRNTIGNHLVNTLIVDDFNSCVEYAKEKDNTKEDTDNKDENTTLSSVA